MPKRIVVLVVCFLLALSAACSAEDMHFVDADGATGYYVDADTIVIAPAGAVMKDGSPDWHISDASVAVVKAHENRRYIYKAQFDCEHKKYRIFETIVQAYDTKDVLQDEWRPTAWLAYGASSPMRTMVDFIYEWQAEQDRKAAMGL